MTSQRSRVASVDADTVAVVVLLVVDSHLVFADALAHQLRKEVGPRVVHVSRSVADSRRALAGEDSDIVVLHDDGRVSDKFGILRELTDPQMGASVLVLSGTDEPGTVIEALRAGARGWISKDMDLGALVAAIAEVEQGHLYLSPPVMTAVMDRLLSTMPVHSPSHNFIDSLSQREMEILRCLVAGMTKREIAERLFLSIHTVRSHVQRMMRRSDQHSTLALIAMAQHVGVPPIEEEFAEPQSGGDGGRSAP